MRSLLSMSRVMYLGMVRDRTAVFFMLLFPLMFLVLFGAIFQNTDSQRTHLTQVGDVAVLDQLSEQERAAWDDSLRIERTEDAEAARQDVAEGTTDGVITESADGQVELYYSSADPARAGTVTGLVNSLVQEANIAASEEPRSWHLESFQVEDESVQPIQFIAPGLLGYAVAMGASFMSALTLVNWRKKRLLRRLWLSPVRPATVVGARVGVSLGLALVQLAVFVGVAVIPFYGLQLTGDWWLSVPLVAAGTLAFMSVGLVIGALTRTEEAANGVLQVVILPMAFLSGSFFPTEGLPGPVRTAAQFLPLHHLNDALMSVLSQNGSWSDALPAIGVMLAFAAVLTAVAARVFRWDNA